MFEVNQITKNKSQLVLVVIISLNHSLGHLIENVSSIVNLLSHSSSDAFIITSHLRPFSRFVVVKPTNQFYVITSVLGEAAISWRGYCACANQINMRNVDHDTQFFKPL